MKRERVLIVEHDELDGWEHWWTGSFSAAMERGKAIEDVTFDEALAWARSVAEVVEVDVEDLGRYVD